MNKLEIRIFTNIIYKNKTKRPFHLTLKEAKHYANSFARTSFIYL